MQITQHLVFMLAMALLASCSTGLDTQMADLLDQVEGELGYVNTIGPDDMAKMALWFDRHGDDSQKARSLFCLGRSLLNERSYSAAVVNYTKALEMAENLSDPSLEGLILRDMALACGATGDSPDEQLYLGRASVAFREAGLKAKGLEALLNLGRSYSSSGRSEEAEEIFKSVLFDAHEMRDTLIEARCLEAYAALAVGRENPDPALSVDLLGRASEDLGYPLSCSDMGILAYSYSLAGNQKEAGKWLSMARSAAQSEVDEADVDFRDYQISSRQGDASRALKALERVNEYANRSQAATLGETVAASQREYLKSQSEAGIQKLRSARLLLLIFALVALLLIGAALSAYLYLRSSAKRRLEAEVAERERYMSIAEDLGGRLAAIESRRAADKDNPRHGPEFEALERLCEQYYIYEGTSNLQPKILGEVKSIIEGFRSDKKTQKALEDSLDREMDGVMSKLRAEFPSWKEDDFRLYSFTASGFSSATISALMEKDKSVIYNRVWRLKGRISSSASALKDFFLKCLES